MAPVMTTKRTTKTLTKVKMLVKMADDLMPKPRRTVQNSSLIADVEMRFIEHTG